MLSKKAQKKISNCSKCTTVHSVRSQFSNLMSLLLLHIHYTLYSTRGSMQIYINCSPEKNVLYCGTVVQQKTNIFNSWSSPYCYKKCCKAKIKFPRTDIQNYFSKALTWSKKSGKIAEKDLHLWTENTTLPANLGFFKDLFLYLSNYT